jgi:predicted carbohydrate-binding protein with CBM5 and CBM33 domain
MNSKIQSYNVEVENIEKVNKHASALSKQLKQPVSASLVLNTLLNIFYSDESTCRTSIDMRIQDIKKNEKARRFSTSLANSVSRLNKKYNVKGAGNAKSEK